MSFFTSPVKWMPWKKESSHNPQYQRVDSPMVKPVLWRTPQKIEIPLKMCGLSSFLSPSTPGEITTNARRLSIESSPLASPSWNRVSRTLMMKRPRALAKCRLSLLTFPDYDCLRPKLGDDEPTPPLSDVSSGSSYTSSSFSPRTSPLSLPWLQSNSPNQDIRDTRDTLAQCYKDWVCDDTKTLVNGFGRLCDQRAGTDLAAVRTFRRLTANYLFDSNVTFDTIRPSSSGSSVLATSSNGFSIGVHEWSLQILCCGESRQEIGVVEKPDCRPSDGAGHRGVDAMPQLGAKIVYGNELSSASSYYASYNGDGSVRVKKTVAQKRGWAAGDVVRTVLNLKKSNIQFFINGRKARKTLSVPNNRKYFPTLMFTGNCKYRVLHCK